MALRGALLGSLIVYALPSVIAFTALQRVRPWPQCIARSLGLAALFVYGVTSSIMGTAAVLQS